MLQCNNFTSHLKSLIPFLLKEAVTLLFGITILSVYVIIITLSVPFYIYRFILLKVTPYVNPDLGKMLQARSQYLGLEEFTENGIHSPRANVVACIFLQGHVEVEEVREKLMVDLIQAKNPDGSLKYPEASQYVVTYRGYKFWRNDPNFSIENHVTEYSTPNAVFTEENLRNLMESLSNQPFPACRSPWEYIIVHNYISHEGSRTLLVLKFHHCLADGFGALYTFLSALSSKPLLLPKPRYSERGTLRLFLFRLTFPLRLVRDVSHFIAISFLKSPWKVKDKRKSWKQVYQHTSVIPVERIKEIRNRFGVSFTSVVHSVIAGGMEKLLEKMYGNKSGIKSVPCVMMLPLPGHPRKFRNHCTGAYVNLPTKSMDPIERLKICEEDLFSVKKSTLPMLGQWLPIIGGAEPIPFARILAKNRSFPVSLSNFPLGTTEYEIIGCRVVHISCISGPAQGVAGLGVVAHTYMDNLQIGFLAEQGVFTKEDLDFLAREMKNEVNILQRHVQV